MNYIEIKFQNGTNKFVMAQTMAEQIKYIKIGDKSIHFVKHILDEDSAEIFLVLNEVFPTDVFYDLQFIDKENQNIDLYSQMEGVIPFFGEVQGILKAENKKIKMKFLHLNALFTQVKDAPILQIENLFTSEGNRLKREAIKDSSNLLAIATQRDTSIHHIVPLHFKKDEIILSSEYLTGLFDVAVIVLKNEHAFRISENTNNKEKYVSAIKQQTKCLGNLSDKVKYEGVEDNELIFNISSVVNIKKAFLLTDNVFEELQWDDKVETITVSNQISANIKSAYLLLYTEEGFYTKNLKDEISQEQSNVPAYVDLTKYNFHKSHLKNVTPLSVKDIRIKGTALLFSLNDDSHNDCISETPFLLVKQRNNGKIYYIHGERESNCFYFNFYYLLDTLETKNGTRWDFYLINNPKSTISYQLGMFEDALLERPERFFEPFKQNFENDSTYKQRTRIYITVNNELAMVRNNLSNLIKEEFKLKAQVIGFKMKKNMVDLQISVMSPFIKDLQLNSLHLIQRNKDSLDQRSFSITEVDTFNGKTVVNSTINLKEADLYPLYWDLYIGIIGNEKKYYVKINSVAQKIAWDINQTISKYQYQINNSDIIYPYMTLSNDLSFTYREKEFFENRYYLLKENLAYLYVQLFYKHYAKRNIWLAFEKLAISAHDSGYYFFDYVYKNQKHDEFYYIIQKNSPEIKNLSDKKDKIIYFMSFKYFVYMFASKLLISSDTKRNSYNLKLKKSKLAKTLTNKKLVYLQHGVNGLKRVPDFHKNRDVFDLVIAPSEFEKQMIVNDWGYDESEVAATGLARWDGLVDRTEEIPYKQIFLMPTWRTWMDGMEKDKFKESEYFKKYNEFLSSEKLHALLEEHNVKIKFFLHPKFRDYIDLFDSKSSNIEKFGFLEVPMDEMIMKSSLMISDYSSVIWEMFYLKKPCVFFHFDKDKYLEYEGAYMDFDTDLFGDVAYETSDLISIVENYIQNGFEEKNEYAEMRNEYFTFMDNHNSERIYKVIEENKDWLISDSLKIPKFKLSHLIPYSVRRKILDIKNSILK
ncbi:CDP-glycerol glycerophosphotransferase family protein [Oceanobacillus sojae]|uniref:Uncharacterized protein n=1 Tax=Oceanobacillus sojae TaxID=582851 RepID=A0A511ZQL2_9BACI|nr:CDP-glycerol glycerophosphotransferase family protein [Oceanobacillus sojae]GEN89740.1 hypothetical protein OSO01_44790 [Oceanobacillus sojae]